jgi:hypothetical protein
MTSPTCGLNEASAIPLAGGVARLAAEQPPGSGQPSSRNVKGIKTSQDRHALCWQCGLQDYLLPVGICARGIGGVRFVF